MHLSPYLRVDDTSFRASRADIVAGHGAPARSGRNDVGLNELDYGRVVYRFQDSGRLEEVTQQAHTVHLGAVAVPFTSLAAFVRTHDAGAFERAGFVVSPRFGLTFDPADPCWVTALARHCIASWRAL
jgi:hypothetical protein